MTDDITTTFHADEAILCPPAWAGLIKQLVHLAQFSGGLQVLDGDVGAGKTVFAQQLSDALSAEVSYGILALPAGLMTAQILDCLLTALGVDVEGGHTVGQSIIMLKKADAELKSQQLRKVLIIDDAHHFDDQALVALVSIFQGNDETEIGLSFIFVAKPGLAQRLDAMNIVDVEVRDSLIPAFSLLESKSLIAQHLKRAFPSDDCLLNDEALVAIWNESGGLPGPALKMATAAWVDQNKPSEQWFQRIPIWHVLALVLLLIVLLLGYAFSSDEEEASAETVSFQFTSDALNSESKGELNSNVPPKFDDLSTSTADKKSDQDRENLQGNTAINSAEVLPDPKVGAMSSPIRQPQVSSSQAASSEAANFEVTTSKVAKAKAIASRELSSEASFSSAEKEALLALNTKQGAAVSTASVARPAADPVRQLPSPLPNSLKGLTPDEAYLMKRPRQGFVIQVLAANSLASLENFVSKQSNRRALRIYKTKRSGKDWYVVAEGFYADRGSALSAINNLPKAQLQAGPWPKSIAAVRLEITAAQ